MGRAHLIHLTPHLREVKYLLEAIRDPMPNVMRVPDSQFKKGNLRASTSYTHGKIPRTWHIASNDHVREVMSENSQDKQETLQMRDTQFDFWRESMILVLYIHSMAHLTEQNRPARLFGRRSRIDQGGRPQTARPVAV